MKRLLYALLVTLVPLCMHAMETGGPLEVFFKFDTPQIPRLHNKMTAVQVEDRNTLATAINILNRIHRISAGFQLYMICIFDSQMILHAQWIGILISRIHGDIVLQGISPKGINQDNPIIVQFPAQLTNPFLPSEKDWRKKQQERSNFMQKMNAHQKN